MAQRWHFGLTVSDQRSAYKFSLTLVTAVATVVLSVHDPREQDAVRRRGALDGVGHIAQRSPSTHHFMHVSQQLRGESHSHFCPVQRTSLL